MKVKPITVRRRVRKIGGWFACDNLRLACFSHQGQAELFMAYCDVRNVPYKLKSCDRHWTVLV